MRGVALVLSLVFVISGCLTNQTSPSAPEPLGPATALGQAFPPQLLVNATFVGQEWDVLCLFGGGPLLRREDGWVLPGTTIILVQVSVDPTFTGMQVGYTIDGDGRDHIRDDPRAVWLGPPVRGGDAEWRIQVLPNQTETPGKLRWHFYEQMKLPGPDQPCYTGGGTGRWSVRVEALSEQAS